MQLKRKISIILLSSFVIIGGVALFFFYSSSGKKESLDDIGFSMSGLEDFTLVERFRPHFSEYEGNEERITLTENGSSVIKITSIQNAERSLAEEYIVSQSALLEGMFDTRIPPYPELLTNATGCDEELLPQKKQTTLGIYYTTYADERLNQGICAQDITRYKVGLGIFYCEQSKRIVKVMYYRDKGEDFSKIVNSLESFSCPEK